MKLLILLISLLSLSLAAEIVRGNKNAVACVNDPTKKLCIKTTTPQKICWERDEFSSDCGSDEGAIWSDQLEDLRGNAKYMLSSFVNDWGDFYYYVKNEEDILLETITIPEGEVCVFRVRNDNRNSHSLMFKLGTQDNVDAYVYEEVEDTEYEARGQLLLSDQNSQDEMEFEIGAYNFAYVVVTPNAAREGVFGATVKTINDFGNDSLSLGAILGIVFGSLFLLVIIIIVLVKIFKLWRSKSARTAQQNDAQCRMIDEEILQSQAPQSYPQIDTNQPQIDRLQPEISQKQNNPYIEQQIAAGNITANQSDGHLNMGEPSPPHPQSIVMPRYPAGPAKKV